MKKNEFISTKKMIYMALCIALNIIFVRFLSVQTPILRFDFGFIPIFASSVLCGPLLGGITGALSDVLGMLVNSKGLSYFFPYTINAFLYGYIYGLFFYKKKHTFKKTVICVLLEMIFINIALSSVWAYLFMKYVMGNTKAFGIIFMQRVTLALPLTVVRTAGIEIMNKYVLRYFDGEKI